MVVVQICIDPDMMYHMTYPTSWSDENELHMFIHGRRVPRILRDIQKYISDFLRAQSLSCRGSCSCANNVCGSASIITADIVENQVFVQDYEIPYCANCCNAVAHMSKNYAQNCAYISGKQLFL